VSGVRQRRVDGPALVWAVARTMPWSHLAVSGALAVAFVVVARLHPGSNVSALVDYARFAAVVLATGAAGTLDDGTRPHLDGVAAPLALRQGVRLGLTLVTVTSTWLLVMLVAWTAPEVVALRAEGVALPFLADTVVVAALVLVALATAGVATRRRGGSGMLPGAGAAITLPAALAAWRPTREVLLPRFVPVPADSSVPLPWATAQRWWAAIGAIALVVLCLSLRDVVATPRSNQEVPR
jgi:hypothetical protein